MVGSARLYVCAHKTTRFIVAINYAAEELYRYLIASDLRWRTLDIVQGQTLTLARRDLPIRLRLK